MPSSNPEWEKVQQILEKNAKKTGKAIYFTSEDFDKLISRTHRHGRYFYAKPNPNKQGEYFVYDESPYDPDPLLAKWNKYEKKLIPIGSYNQLKWWLEAYGYYPKPSFYDRVISFFNEPL